LIPLINNITIGKLTAAKGMPDKCSPGNLREDKSVILLPGDHATLARKLKTGM
jgi:hypothetical protein